MAVLSVERPALAGGQSVEVVFQRNDASPGPSLSLVSALGGHSCIVVLAFTRPVATTTQIDVLSALRTALSSGAASVWQEGALASQARVEVAVAGTSMRLVADVTAFKGGGMSVDLQFANDRAMEGAGGTVAYTATVTMDGRQVARETVQQLQYQSWHREFATSADGGQGLGSPSAGWLNIKHDIAELSRVGTIADYDLSLKIPEETLEEYAAATSTSYWNSPLASNGVQEYMPGPGGRPDIGITTAHNTAWLISQDARAAAFAMGQAEAAGAVPWRYWDAANKTWLNAENYPKLWTDPRGGAGRPGDRNSTGPTQFFAWAGPDTWTPEAAHQPDLSFVPYVLTGERWILDNLLAQGAWNTVANWPDGERYNEVTGKYDLVVHNVQVRAAAWSLRQLENAAWAAPDGSKEQAYFRATADANWKWLVAQIPEWTARRATRFSPQPHARWRARPLAAGLPRLNGDLGRIAGQRGCADLSELDEELPHWPLHAAGERLQRARRSHLYSGCWSGRRARLL
jgi:hypothetical protein